MSNKHGSVLGLSSVPLRELHGRTFNPKDDYMLPADRPEHKRLDAQHELLKLHLQSLYDQPDRVEHVLINAFQYDRRPLILDLGTGSGRWAIDMAEAFPKADVIGYDIVAPSALFESPSQLPSNVSFEVRDANAKLTEHYGKVDIIHARAIEPGIQDFDAFFYEVARCLRPEGVLLMSSGEANFLDENHKPFPRTHEGQPGYVALQTMFGRVYECYRDRGNTGIDGPIYWHEWLEANSNFKNVVTSRARIPLGPWKAGSDVREILVSNMCRDNVLTTLGNLQPFMLTCGRTREECNRELEACTRELMDLKIHALLQWNYVTASRNDLPWAARTGPAPKMDRSRRRCVPITNH